MGGTRPKPSVRRSLASRWMHSTSSAGKSQFTTQSSQFPHWQTAAIPRTARGRTSGVAIEYSKWNRSGRGLPVALATSVTS